MLRPEKEKMLRQDAYEFDLEACKELLTEIDRLRKLNQDFMEYLDRSDKMENKLGIAVAALEVIADPRKRTHTEPDEYTQSACLMHLADEALKQIRGE